MEEKNGNKYVIQMVFVVNGEMTPDELLALGTELIESFSSFVKAKRLKITVGGLLTIFEGDQHG